MTQFPATEARWLVTRALEEDLSRGDPTTECLFPEPKPCRAELLAREQAVLAGMPAVALVYEELGGEVQVAPAVAEGASLACGDRAARLEGSASALLRGERVALNFLQHLCGIASLTRRYVEAAAPHGVSVFDTRKTTPGWRALEKYAVRIAGGCNHRMELGGAVLIKDNHLALLEGLSSEGACRDLVARMRRSLVAGMVIEVEADSIEAASRWARAGVDFLLLDNLEPEQAREAVRRIREAQASSPRKLGIEISGGINLGNIEAYARLGVDRISVGRLTHSAPCIDFSLRILS